MKKCLLRKVVCSFILNIALLIKDKQGVDVFVKKQIVLKLTLLLIFDAAQCFTTRIILPDFSIVSCSFKCLILLFFSDSWVWRERDRTVGWPIQVFRPLPLFTSWAQVSNQYNSIEVHSPVTYVKGAAHRKGDEETTHCTLLSVFHAGYIELNAHFLNKWISWGGLIPWPP